MKIRSNVKAGDMQHQHNEKLAGDKKTKGLIVKTGIKAGVDGGCQPDGCGLNHNEKLASDNRVKSLTVKTGIKAGLGIDPWITRDKPGDNN